MPEEEKVTYKKPYVVGGRRRWILFTPTFIQIY